MKILIFSNQRHPLKTSITNNNPRGTYIESHYDDISFILPNAGSESIKILVNDVDIRSFDLVYFRHAEKYTQFVGPISAYLTNKNIKFIDSCTFTKYPIAKLLEGMLLQLNGISNPKTIAITNNILFNKYELICSILGKPFILKENSASHGKLNFLISNKTEFIRTLNTHKNSNYLFLCQEYLPNKFDYRFITFGYKVVLIKKRIRTNLNSHLNNTFLGANVEVITPKSLPNLCKLASISAKITGVDVAGVDILVNENNGRAYVLEVNTAPDLKDVKSIKLLSNYLDKLAKNNRS